MLKFTGGPIRCFWLIGIESLGLKTEFIDSIGARLGYKISLAIESGDVIASPAVMQEQEAEEQLNQDKSSLLDNPVLKDILDSFDGKIIDESINKVSS